MAVLEVCCYSCGVHREAERCGADRIELAPHAGRDYYPPLWGASTARECYSGAPIFVARAAAICYLRKSRRDALTISHGAGSGLSRAGDRRAGC